MRLLVLATCPLQGCSVLGAGLAAESNRQRRSAATTAGADLAAHLPVEGDTLNVRLTGGTAARGAFAGLTGDSLRLDAGTFALTDVAWVERPWKRESVGQAFFIGVVADATVLWFAFRDLTFSSFGDFNFDGP